jgi:hypothetical protein
MTEKIFKEFSKYGIIGLILLYFLVMDYQSRNVSLEVQKKSLEKFETMKEKQQAHDLRLVDKKIRIQYLEKDVDKLKSGDSR